jgi:site-specific DNA-methyltransferase (adenine-specific)
MEYGIKGVSTDNKGTRYPISILDFAQQWRRQDQVHPTQKPVALLEYLIKTYTNEGETILDNCMGSGSTGVACIRTKRKFIGIELNDEYFDIAQKRINQEQQQLSLF